MCYAPPGDELYAQLQVAVTEAPAAARFSSAPWQAWWRRCAPAAMRGGRATEYDALFLGVGKPEVFLYGSYYLAGALNEKPLVDAARRSARARAGARPEAVSETEDHLACLFEVMRYLIAGDDVGVSNLARAAALLPRPSAPWVEALCDALEAHPARRLLSRRWPDSARDFFAVEAQGFDLLDA